MEDLPFCDPVTLRKHWSQGCGEVGRKPSQRKCGKLGGWRLYPWAVWTVPLPRLRPPPPSSPGHFQEQPARLGDQTLCKGLENGYRRSPQPAVGCLGQGLASPGAEVAGGGVPPEEAGLLPARRLNKISLQRRAGGSDFTAVFPT